MYDGSCWFSVPSPYESHDPIGRDRIKEIARMQLSDGDRMIWTVRVHRAQNTQIVRVLCGMWQEFAHEQTGLSRMLEARYRPE